MRSLGGCGAARADIRAHHRCEAGTNRCDQPVREGQRRADPDRYGCTYALPHARHYFVQQGDTMKRKASAVWKGGLKDGKGSISTESGVLSNTQYGFNARFENGPGTNPEELIGAAHAGCFSMALSAQLGEAKLTAESIRTTATVTLEKVGAVFAITAVHLDLVAKIP